MSLESAVNEYIMYHEWERNSRPKTIVWHKKNFECFKKYLSSLFPSPQLSNFTDINIRNFLLTRVKDEGISMRTALNQWQSLRAFSSFLISREYLDKDPMLKVTRPKVERKLPNALNEDEVKTLIKYMVSRRKKRYRMAYLRDLALIGCFLFAGLRRSEAMNLNISDIDIPDKVIKLQRTKTRRVEIVPINKTLLTLLENYLPIRNALKRNTDKLFVCTNRSGHNKQRGDGSFQTRGLQLLLREINDNIGSKISQHIHPHLLRRTFGTLLLRKGVNIVNVSRLLRHSDISITCRSYIGWNGQELSQAIEKCNISLA